MNWVRNQWIVSKLGKNNQPRNYNHSSSVSPLIDRSSSLWQRRQMPLADGGANKVSFRSSLMSYVVVLIIVLLVYGV